MDRTEPTGMTGPTGLSGPKGLSGPLGANPNGPNQITTILLTIMGIGVFYYGASALYYGASAVVGTLRSRYRH